jgi:SWI/SNF-related matrix-associated actin-dependent regulator 1 of chromatin subfamily A
MKAPIPAPFGKSYLPYQEKFIRYALGGRGTLLADEMGLGKTIQAIGLINAMPLNRDTGRLDVLIVAPASLVDNWHRELDEWKVPGEIHCDVVTWDGLKRLVSESKPYDLLVVDEAHYGKNPLSGRSQALTAIAPRCGKIVLMTGTPIDGRPIELWPLLRVLDPDTWDPATSRIGVISPEQKKSHPGEGPNFWAYAKRYCGLKKTTFPGKRTRSAWDFSGATNLDELRTKLRRSCMVRRLKSEVLAELPEKRRQIVMLPGGTADDSDLMPGVIELDNYDDVVKMLQADRVKFEEWSKRRSEQAIEKLPYTLEFLDDMLDSIDKVIVFAHHLHVVSTIASHFYGQNPAVITGETTNRQAQVDKFQRDPTCKLFIGTFGAAGVGHTLTAASTVVCVELDPRPAYMSQAEDRAHRIGQKNAVNVYHLVQNGTLCSRLAKILVQKQAVIQKALDE